MTTMKILALFFFVGIASASFYDDLDKAADEMVHGFLRGLEGAPPLKSVLGAADNYAADEAEDDIKTELGKKLRETLQEVLEKIKEAIDKGKNVGKEVLDKMKEVREKMKELKVNMDEKTKELFNKIKDKVREIIKTFLEKLRVNKLSVRDGQVAHGETSIRDMLRKLKEHLLEKVDAEYIREKILKIFGQGTELVKQLLKTLREKGVEKLRMFIDYLLGDDEDADKRSLSDMWEKVKNYFKDLQIDLKEKYFKFGKWLKEVVDKGILNSKDKFENIKVLAEQFLKHAKGISKEIAVEAKDFFLQYKDQLGELWEEIKDSVQEVMDKHKEN